MAPIRNGRHDSGDKNKNINTRRCQNLPLVFLLAENKKF
jgi:hypothetical protein